MNSKHHEQDRLDTEGSFLKTEVPKVLTLDTEKEKLTPERIKVRLLVFFLIDLYLQEFATYCNSCIECFILCSLL